MKDRLFKLLGIETGEESMVSMLLTQSVFLGIFFGAFDISAHSIFLSVYDEKMMARAYVISGLAGIVLTGSYTWLQAKLRFHTFSVTNLIFVNLLTFLLWLAILLFPGKIVTFAIFVMLGPLNILAMLGFWGTTGRLFTLRQGKRLFGLVDAGLVIGIIISCYAIPVLLSLKFSSHNILLISTASVLAATVIQTMIGRRFTYVVVEEKAKSEKGTMSIFRENSYIRMMGVFVALSVMTAFFVQYSFMAVTRLQYPMEEDMARFLGLFTGSMMIFTLLIKLLVFSYLIKNYGLKICLAISPILVVAFTALAILIGMTMGIGATASSGFIIFFLILALSRLFSKSLKDSIESPSFKVIYQTVNEKIRYEVQAGIDGTVNEISALSSGLLLAGLGALAFIKLIHFSLVLFIIIIAWIYVAFKLYQEYRKSIRDSLDETESTSASALTDDTMGQLKSHAAGNAMLKNNNFRIIKGDLAVLDKTENEWFLLNLGRQAETYQDLSLLPALRKIEKSGVAGETARQKAAEVIDQLSYTNGDPRKLKKSVINPVTDEKLINARKALADTRMPQTTEILRLLRDNNIESKRTAIYLIGKFGIEDMIPEVCDCLKIKGLETDAISVLADFGEKAYNPLFRFYLSASGNNELSRMIIRLIGNSANKDNTDFLFARLWSNSRILKETAAELLVKNGYKADEDEKDKLHQLITDLIGMLTWNISAQETLNKTENSLLKDVINRETSQWTNFLFNLLSIAYEKSSLDKIRSNIESGTVGSVNYALEMIDIVIEDAIKPRLISLIDAVPDEEKLKNLHQFYPGEVLTYEKLIEDILNRDYNLISIWAKACALHSLNELENPDLKESVTALLFSPERILREEAARLISRTDKHFFREISIRIQSENLPVLEKIVEGRMPENEYLFEKTVALRKFFNVPEDQLILLAQSIISNTGQTGSPDFTDEYLAWPAGETDIMGSAFLEGGLAGEEGAAQRINGTKEYFMLNLSLLDEFSSSYPESVYEIYKKIESAERP